MKSSVPMSNVAVAPTRASRWRRTANVPPTMSASMMSPLSYRSDSAWGVTRSLTIDSTTSGRATSQAAAARASTRASPIVPRWAATKGRSQRRFGPPLPTSGGSPVGVTIAAKPSQCWLSSSRLTIRRPTAGSANSTSASASSARTRTTQWSPRQWIIAGRASSFKRSRDTFMG